MDFVDRYRLLNRIAVIALIQPIAITPVVTTQFRHNRAGIGTYLMAKAIGIGLLIAMTGLITDLIFINIPHLHARDEQLPAASQALLHRVMASIPTIEIAHHRHGAGIGGPQAELHAHHPLPFAAMGAHATPDVVMVALGEEVAIQFAHPLLTKGPRVVLLMHDAGPSHPQPVTAAGICWHLGLKDPGVMGGLGGPCRRLPFQQQLNGFRIWHPAAHNPTAVTELLGSQDGRRMVVTTVRQTLRVLSHPFKAGYGHDGWLMGMGRAGSLGSLRHLSGRWAGPDRWGNQRR